MISTLLTTLITVGAAETSSAAVDLVRLEIEVERACDVAEAFPVLSDTGEFMGSFAIPIIDENGDTISATLIDVERFERFGACAEIKNDPAGSELFNAGIDLTS